MPLVIYMYSKRQNKSIDLKGVLTKKGQDYLNVMSLGTCVKG